MTTMATHDYDQPPSAERPKRRMVLRKIGETSPATPRVPSRPAAGETREMRPRAPSLPAIASREAPPTRRAPAPSVPSVSPTPRRASRPAAATLRPPPSPESDPNLAAPIPLTRLHTPSARFQSAMDLPPYRPSAQPSPDEGPIHETSSTTLPPLVASLPPPSPAFYLPSSGRTSRAAGARVAAFWGAVGAATLIAILGGVVVGRRVARSNDEAPVHVLASAPQAPAHDTAAIAAPVEAPALGSIAAAAASPAAAAAGGGGASIEAMPVESLPRAPAVSTARALPPAPRPVARPVAAAPVAHGDAVAASAPVRAAEKDPAPSNDVEGSAPTQGGANAKTTLSQATQAPVAAPPAEPPAAEAPTDPLVKAVRADIEEEESRRK